MPAPKGFKPKVTFAKGVSGNPNGRPKNVERIRIESRAALDYDKWYEGVSQAAFVGKEPWAYKLLYDHLPKKLRESEDRFIIKQDTTTLDTQIDSLRKGLGEIEDHDINSATTILKALSSTKFAEVEAQTEATVAGDNKAMLAKIDQGLDMLNKLEQRGQE